ncbi:MAG: hypothetical protein KF819_34690 [Labilithrix sp.]|nr:hypothetical protein [Labilithrix sp.]
MSFARWFVVGSLVLGCVVACGSTVGDACNEEGKIEGQCPNDAICGKGAGDALVCLKQCSDGAQCPSGEECGGVSKTSLKGCRPKR